MIATRAMTAKLSARETKEIVSVVASWTNSKPWPKASCLRSLVSLRCPAGSACLSKTSSSCERFLYELPSSLFGFCDSGDIAGQDELGRDRGTFWWLSGGSKISPSVVLSREMSLSSATENKGKPLHYSCSTHRLHDPTDYSQFFIS